ncbi:hydrolase [Leptospira ryugenii]|uniref:Hydrolase n=1 Tax=Leptospira ryugenii TaxID=1917863 RepID=A0A2P2E170_9LEPT|nr:alpha/beta hydrolase [Leptospira ryugenii]GBF50619.1 hydrolase [Leptospira ryugenii]
MNESNLPKRNATEWLASGKYFDYNKFQIFYINEGRGSNLLLLHGFPTSSWDYSKVFAGFSRFYNCFAIDFLGFGYSSKPEKHNYHIIEQTDIIESFIEKNALKRVKFVFHDYAVSVGQEILARHLDPKTKKYEIDGAVFLNGGLFPHLHRPTTTQKLLTIPYLGAFLAKLFNFKKFSKAFSEVFGPNTKPEERELASLWKIVTYPGNVKIGNRLLHYIKDRKQYADRWHKAIEQTEVPLLFINGESDPVSGKHLVDYLEKLKLKNARIIRWPEIGHYPQWENAKGSYEEIHKFFKSLQT